MTILKSTFDIGDIEINICSSATPETITPCKSYLSNNHFHHYTECLFTEKGYFDINANNTKQRINEGEICIIPKMMNHCTCGCSEKSVRTGFMFYMKHKKKGSPELYNKFSKLFTSDKPIIFKASDELANYLKTSVHRNICSNESETVKSLHLYALIIITLAEEIEDIHDIVSLTEQNTEENDRMYYIENYIYDNYMKNITLKTLADELHICERQLNRILTANTGHTFSDILFQQRMLAARELLSTPGIKAIDVPEKTGFRSYSGFYTSFKKFWGMSPRELIETIR